MNRITRIVGANVAVVTRQRGSTNARSSRACIVSRARISVAAWVGVVDMHTAGCRVAGIVGANVGVVANQRRTAQAGSARTNIADCAGVAVAAWIGVVGVRAARGGVTPVVGADVAVAAIRRRTTHAYATGADVARGTSVTVAAGVGVVGEHADAARARICRAHVAVVALAVRAALNTTGNRRAVARTA